MMHNLNPTPILKQFFKYPETDIPGRILFVKDGVLYSYGLHAPLAVYYKRSFFCFVCTATAATFYHTECLRDFIKNHKPAFAYHIQKNCPTFVPLKSPEWQYEVKQAISQRTKEVNAVLTSGKITSTTQSLRSAELRELLNAWAAISKKDR